MHVMQLFVVVLLVFRYQLPKFIYRFDSLDFQTEKHIILFDFPLSFYVYICAVDDFLIVCIFSLYIYVYI